MKKIIALTLILITLSSCTSCTMIANIFNPELSNKYDKLIDMLRFLDLEKDTFTLHIKPDYQLESSDDLPPRMTKIKELLDDFPDNYEDVEEIREEYKYLESYFKELFNSRNSYSERQRAAMHLLKIDKEYSRWGLTNAIFYYTYSIEAILKAVLLGNWEDESGYYLGFHEESNNDIWFSHNLPTAKNSDVEYYYFTENHIIGFYPKGDSSSKFNAFRVTDISHKAITIYCYKNNSYYILHNTTDLF